MTRAESTSRCGLADNAPSRVGQPHIGHATGVRQRMNPGSNGTVSVRSRPRILVIGPTPPPYNGMSVSTENLLKSGLRERFDLILLDTADRRGLTNVGKFDLENVLVALRLGLKFLWLIGTKRPDVVYVPIAQNRLGYLRDCLLLVPCRLLRRRVVVHLHGSDFRRFCEQSPGWFRWLVRWTLRDVRKAIVLGQQLRGMFDGLVPEQRVSVIANGIPRLTVDPDCRPRADTDSGRRQVLYLGTVMQAKGFMDIVRSLPLVLRDVPTTHYVIAGEHCDPEEIREAVAFIQGNELQNAVTMAGVVAGQEKMRVLLESDVFAFPPVAPEGQPLVILEAMAAGLPIITTDQGAIRETVLDGVNGFIVPKGNPQAIAEKIVLLLKDERLRRRMGQASRERFLEHYTLERWGEDMCRVFDEAVKDYS